MIYFIVPILVGISIVLQGTFNRQIAGHSGLASAVFLNGVVFFVACLAFYLVARFYPQALPEIFHLKRLEVSPSWWWLLPGIFGFVIVAGVPFAISHLGALKVFVLIIATQIVFSMGWDYLVDQQPVGAMRLAGSALVMIGAMLVSLA